MTNPRYPRYQDYVIKNGRLVAEFEQMYRDYEDPWHQSLEPLSVDKAVAIHLMRKMQVHNVIELGCGHGHFTASMTAAGLSALGIDISPTAIEKARTLYPQCRFQVGEVLSFEIYRDFKPDLIVMAEVTWYILDQLDQLLSFFKEQLPHTYLLHLLVTYPPGVQQYGADKFTTLSGIMQYFKMDYLEWGEAHQAGADTTRTYFLGQWPDNRP